MFYCPNCRAEREAEPTNTITTNSGRVAYKANCSECGQDMAEFVEEKKKHDDANEKIAAVEANERVENVDLSNSDRDIIQENDRS